MTRVTELPDLRAIEALDVFVDDGTGADQHVGELIERRDFVTFGERVGVRAAATERMLMTLVTGLGRRLADTSKPGLESIGFEERATRHLERTIDERSLALR